MICLWVHLTGPAGEGPIEKTETSCPEGRASLDRSARLSCNYEAQGSCSSMLITYESIPAFLYLESFFPAVLNVSVFTDPKRTLHIICFKIG